METNLRTYKVGEVCEGFVYNELEGKGLYGLSGRLTIRQSISLTIFESTCKSGIKLIKH